jgi:hypothetical protein
LQESLLTATANGEKLCIATHRRKYDADGDDVTGDDDAPGTFRTDGYEFQTEEDTWTVDATPELVGTTPAHLFALELAVQLTPDIMRSLLDIKVILDRFGGQFWIAPYIPGEQVLGFIFAYSHISKLGKGKEPDADIARPMPLLIHEPVASNGNGHADS